MWFHPFLPIRSSSSICFIIILIHLSCKANCFVPAKKNIPLGTSNNCRIAAAAATNDEDFASFDSESGEDGGGQQLASEFYQELEYRRRHGEETYTTTVASRNKPKQLFNTRTPPAQKPAVSAGLFSGGGSTVYSSGRSIRAEIDILNRSMTEEAKRREGRNAIDLDLIPEQMESLLKFVGVSLVFLAVAGAVLEVSGGGGISNIMIGVGNGEVFMGEEAAWLIKESSMLAASIVDAVCSVEGMLLF